MVWYYRLYMQSDKNSVNKSIENEFVRAYDELADPLYRRLVFKISNTERAKELLQETFTKCWEYISKGNEIGNLKAFIYKTANNLIIDEYRKKSADSLDNIMEGGFEPSVDSHHQIESYAEEENVKKAIEDLPKKYKEVVVMRFVEGLELGDIASLVGDTENAVSVRLNRAVKKLRDVMEIYEKPI